MKKIKVMYHGKRLKDIYPHATQWQVFKFRVRKLVRKLVILGLFVLFCTALVVVTYKYAQTHGEAVTYEVKTVTQIKEVVVDHLPEKIEKLKDEIVADIKKGESSGYTEDDGVVILDTNNKMSFGSYQFQKATVVYYYKKLYNEDITQKQAILIALDDKLAGDLTKDIIFKEANGWKNWWNTSKKYNIEERVKLIKKLEQE